MAGMSEAPTKRIWPRFSLRGLIGFVALVAVGCAALVNASELWLVAVSTVTFSIVTLAIIVGLFGSGSTRAFAGGFAVGLLAYLSLVFYILRGEIDTMGHIATSRVLKHLYDVTANEIPLTPGMVVGGMGGMGGMSGVGGGMGGMSGGMGGIGGGMGGGAMAAGIKTLSILTPDLDHFMQIGQQLWALVIGCLGGAFAS
jgi:hypothetical protein